MLLLVFFVVGMSAATLLGLLLGFFLGLLLGFLLLLLGLLPGFPAGARFLVGAAGIGRAGQVAVVLIALDLAAVLDDHSLHGRRAVALYCLHALDLAHDLHAGLYLAKDHVLAVQMRCGHGRDEELAAIGVGPRVGHGQQPGLDVAVAEALVCKAMERHTVSPSHVDLEKRWKAYRSP